MTAPWQAADDAPVAAPAKGGSYGRLLYLIPLVVFLVLAGYFFIGLGKNPHDIPSVLIDTPVPEFDLPPLAGRDRGFSSADLKGQVSLVNVFGSWCVACRVEHPLLMQIHQSGAVPLYGINWREPNAEAGPAWLRRYGDPYTLVGADPESKAAIAFGVTGAPETFVVDRGGVIRYKQVGPITPEIWTETLWPIVQELRVE
jgi:cytochrome c biogenesis protein CcmG, thiol:disulfide interchange protein DsbE